MCSFPICLYNLSQGSAVLEWWQRMWAPPHTTFFSLSFSSLWTEAFFACLQLVSEARWKYKIPESCSEHWPSSGSFGWIFCLSMLVKWSAWDHGVWSEALLEVSCSWLHNFWCWIAEYGEKTKACVHYNHNSLNELIGYSNSPSPDNMRFIAAWFNTFFHADLAAGAKFHVTGAHGRPAAVLVSYSHGHDGSSRYIHRPSEWSEAGPSSFKHKVDYLLITNSNKFGVPSANIPKYGPVLFVPVMQTPAEVRQQKWAHMLNLT